MAIKGDYNQERYANGVPAEVFRDALVTLDTCLARDGHTEPMHIRAVGGFALACHGLRTAEDGWTYDIDSATADWTDAQREAVHAVAEAFELPENWLNNEPVAPLDDDPWSEATDVRGDEAATVANLEWEAEYQPISTVAAPAGIASPENDKLLHLQVVSLEVATLGTLARSKALAVADMKPKRIDSDLRDFARVAEADGHPTVLKAARAYDWLRDPRYDGFAEAALVGADRFPGFYDDAPGLTAMAPEEVDLEALMDSGVDLEDALVARVEALGGVGDDWDDPLLDAVLDMAHDEQERYWDDIWD